MITIKKQGEASDRLSNNYVIIPSPTFCLIVFEVVAFSEV